PYPATVISRSEWFTRPEDCVDCDEHFPGEGDDGDLCRFAGVAQSRIDGFHWRSGGQGGDGRHVESLADAPSSGPDAALSSASAAVVVNRREAGEHSDLFWRAAAEFRHQGDQRCG